MGKAKVFIGTLVITCCSVTFAQTGVDTSPEAGKLANYKQMNEFLDDVDKKGRPNGARKEFAAAFSDAQEAILSNKLKKATESVEKLHNIRAPNIYEQSHIHLIDYWYQGRLGNKVAEDDAALKLMEVGAGHVSADAFVEAGVRLLKRQYNSKNFGGAIDTLAALRKEPQAQVELASIATAVNQLDELATSTKDLTQQIKTDETGTWNTRLLKPTFLLDSINGEVKNIGFNCDNKQTTISYKVDSVMSSPEAWGRCNIKINATPNTTFKFTQLANKPTQ